MRHSMVGYDIGEEQAGAEYGDVVEGRADVFTRKGDDLF